VSLIVLTPAQLRKVVHDLDMCSARISEIRQYLTEKKSANRERDERPISPPRFPDTLHSAEHKEEQP